MGDTNQNVRIWGIIPAAGLGQRMGLAKQSLPYRGSTFTATVTRTLLDAGVRGTVVVTRTAIIGQLQLPDDPRVHVALNEDAASEMIDSIRIGLRMLDQLGAVAPDGAVVVPADMPGLSSETCRACIEAYSADPKRIVIARYKEKRGHPMIFPFDMRTVVDTLEGGLRMLASASGGQVQYIDVDDPGVGIDVNTPAEYERLGADIDPQAENL